MTLSLQKLIKTLILYHASLELVLNHQTVVVNAREDETRRVIVKFIGLPDETGSSIRNNEKIIMTISEANIEVMMLNNKEILQLEEDKNVQFVEDGMYRFSINIHEKDRKMTLQMKSNEYIFSRSNCSLT
jgi:hypothetical protein